MSKLLCSNDLSPDTPEGEEGLDTFSVFIRTKAVADLIGLSPEDLVDIDGDADLHDDDYVVAEDDAGQINVEDGKITGVTSVAKADVPGYTEEDENEWRADDEVVNWQPPSDEGEGTDAEPAADEPADDEATGD